MVHDGLTNPFSGKQMFDEATEVGDELELTRPDLDRWALRSHERAIAATDDGRLPEEIVPVTVKGRKGDTVVEVDEGPRRDTRPGDAGQAARRSPARRARTPPATRRASTTAAARSCSPPTSGRANGKEALAEIVAQAQWPTTSPTSPRTPARGREEGAGEGRPERRRHRPVGDQRGVRLGHAELDPRCSASTRTRSTSTAAPWPSATRSAPRARGSSARSCTSCAGAAAASAARRSARGGGQGDAVILKVPSA